MNKLPIYKIVIDDNDDEIGLDLVSIVRDPAIEVMGVKLSKNFNLELLQGSVNSSNVDSYRYNTNNGELILTFNDGSRYRYSGVDFADYENIILGDATCTTEGENEFGSWFIGKSPSVGAAVWEYLIDKGTSYERLGTQLKFSVQSEKKKIIGPALIPDMDIYRRDPDGFEYFIRFSKETIEKLVEKFNKAGSTRRINFNHTKQMVNAFINSSWIKDSENDKSVGYPEFKDLPIGTWFIEVKVEDENFWNSKVKDEGYYSFSIEGILGLEKVEMASEKDVLSFINEMTEDDFFRIYQSLAKISFDFDDTLTTEKGKDMAKEKIQSGNDVYIISARSGVEGMYAVADELGIPHNKVFATGSNKAKVEKVKSLGIDEHIDNNEDVIKELPKVGVLLKKKSKPVRFLQTYSDYPEVVKNNAKRALNWAEENGWGSCGTAVGKARANQLAKGENISRDTISRMASFARHLQYDNKELGDGCAKLMILAWGGREGIEWAQRKLKQIDAKMAEVGERGGIRPSEKAPKSDTPNPNPEGEGTAKGDASTTRGAVVSERVEKILRNKADDFNERYKDKLGYGVNIGMLKTVYQRGVGAFNVSHSPRVQSAEQWALARVNAFLYIVKNGRPENPKYVNDNDLLPKDHPKNKDK